MRKRHLLVAIQLLIIMGAANNVHSQGIWSSEPSNGFTKRCNLSSCVLGEKIYVLGGDEDPYFSGYTDTVEVFDPTAQTWSIAPSLPTDREAFTCSVVGSKIYAIGGQQQGGGSFGTVFVFDSLTKKWDTAMAMPSARAWHTAAVINGKIYVIGGTQNDKRILDTVEIFDPTLNSWSIGPSLPCALTQLASCVINGKIYVMGGYGLGGDHGFFNTLEIFDPLTNVWSAGPPMPTGRSLFTACAINNKIYVTGGQGSTADLKTLDIFDPATNTWSSGPDMPTGREELAVSVVAGKLYELGGIAGSCCALNNVEAFSPSGSGVRLDEESTKFTIRPSISSDHLLITLPTTTDPSSYEIFDALGRAVITGRVLSGSAEFEVATARLAAGAYVVRVVSRDGPRSARFVVSH